MTVFCVCPVLALDAEAQEVESFVDVAYVGLFSREGHFQPVSQQFADLGSDGFGVGAVTVYQHDEVVGVAHQPVVRQAPASSLLTTPSRTHFGVPTSGETPVENRQIDVGQKW